jgi:hypothetical protein
MATRPGQLGLQPTQRISCPHPSCSRHFSRPGALTYHLRHTTQHDQVSQVTNVEPDSANPLDPTASQVQPDGNCHNSPPLSVISNLESNARLSTVTRDEDPDAQEGSEEHILSRVNFIPREWRSDDSSGFHLLDAEHISPLYGFHVLQSAYN